MWLIPGVGYRARWLHTRPSDLKHVFVSQCYGIEVKLLKFFEKLWVRDGTKFDNFAHAYEDMFGFKREHFRKDLLHGYVLWSSLIWIGEPILKRDPQWLSIGRSGEGRGHVWNSKPYFDCSIGNQGAEIERYLASVETYWYTDYCTTWLTEHPRYCSEACAKVFSCMTMTTKFEHLFRKRFKIPN